jgi:uncharacterized protein with ParB-like and HNH nuclease domain
MESQLFSISKIFTERLLRIPDYQRGYAWEEKQLKDFWADIVQLEAGSNHYVGVLTLEDVPETNTTTWTEDEWIIRAKSYSPYYIVDGQQRLTSTIVLVQAIIEKMSVGQKLNYTSSEEIRRKFIYDSKDDGISRSYIFGYEKDNPSYEFLKVRVFNESSENSFPIQETIYTHNLEIAKRFFLERLSDLSISEIESVYKKITQHLLFNIYTISSDIDVYVAFETMNNRGKPLSHLELLKNRLIYLSTKFEEEETEKKNLRHSINESWKSIYHYLGKNKKNQLADDIFLVNHFILYYGDKLIRDDDVKFRIHRISRYRDRYKDYLLEREFTIKNICKSKNLGESSSSISIQDVYNYVKSLKGSVEIWYQILNPEDSQFDENVKCWLEKINRLDVLTYAPLIMIFFQNEESSDSRVLLLRKLEKHIFIQNLALYSMRPSMYFTDTDSLIELALDLNSRRSTPEEIIQKIDKKIEKMLDDDDLVHYMNQQFCKRGFYEWSGIRYFLYEYEVSLQERSKTYREKIKWGEYNEDRRDYQTVEHIYPQRPMKECWTSKYAQYSSKEKTSLRHSLGNLVPLSKPKNSSFSNKCFQDKKRNTETSIGFAYGSLSENEIAACDEWTAKEILERGLRLLDFMEKRWGFNNLKTIEEKIEFLNLEFVISKEGIDIEELKNLNNGLSTKKRKKGKAPVC